MTAAAMVFPPLRDGSRLGLGGAPLGNLFTEVSDDAARAVVTAAHADGCRSYDTAPHYGHGLSEHRIGGALRALDRDTITLSSKVGRLLHPDAAAPRDQNGYVQCLPFSQTWDYSATGMRRSVLDSLQRLGLARLDSVFIHDCDAGVHGAAYPQVLRQVLDEALPELRRLQQEGLVRHVGLGVNDVQVCLDVLQFPLAHPAIEIVMVGAQTVAHWSDALAMVRHRINPGFWDALRAQGLLDAGTPAPA